MRKEGCIQFLTQLTCGDVYHRGALIAGERGVFSVTGLTAGLDYVISVVRYNSHGRSSNVTLEAFTLRTAENRMSKYPTLCSPRFSFGGVIRKLDKCVCRRG